MSSNMLVGLDIGTTKICAAAAEINNSGVNILGVGSSPAEGIRKGVVVNIEAAVEAIKGAVREAESSAGINIKSVSLGISGSHLKGFNSNGAAGLRGKEVTASDKKCAIDSAKTFYLPLDREVLHIIPTEFILDGQEGIHDPIGLSGERLESRVYVITGGVLPIQNIRKCGEKAGLEVIDIVYGAMASANSLLTRDEKEAGVVFVDIGGGTTDIALFRGRALRHASVLGMGGTHITNDIAVGLRINTNEAEMLKKTSGAAFNGIVRDSEEIMINHSGENLKSIPRKYLVEIMQVRCKEMLEMIKAEITACYGYEVAANGVVFAGGTSVLNGFDRLAESVLGLPVRIGHNEDIKVTGLSVNSHIYYAVTGLIKYELESALSNVVYHDILGNVSTMFTDWIKKLSENMLKLKLNNRKKGGLLCLKSRK